MMIAGLVAIGTATLLALAGSVCQEMARRKNDYLLFNRWCEAADFCLRMSVAAMLASAIALSIMVIQL